VLALHALDERTQAASCDRDGVLGQRQAVRAVDRAEPERALEIAVTAPPESALARVSNGRR
jgi:hypothetical protein